ncbi:DUF4870 domain-containing protein [Halostagnicola kamekurae]|nr:DUF4870 domain-containing protein [Halostagnicola kamekurae]
MNTDNTQPGDTRDTTLAAFVHIAALFFGFFIIALVYFASDDSFARENAANALNWHIPLSLVAILVVFIGLVVNQFAGVVMAVGIGIATVCVALIASVKARQGKAWKYPIVPNLA